MTSSTNKLSIVSFQIKWNKETIVLKDFNLNSGTKGLKHEIHLVTTIPIERIKIMPKSKGLWKGLLKDDIIDLSNICDWNDIVHNKEKDNNGYIQILIMGSAAAGTGTGTAATDITPKQKTIFLEDLAPEDIAKVIEPSGLQNLGNTCYLNSVIQCLRVIPQLRSTLSRYMPTSNNNASNTSAATNNSNNVLCIMTLQDTFTRLDRSIDAIQPISFITAVKLAIPEFARTGPRGQPMQQDAEEFYSSLMTIISNETSGSSSSRNNTSNTMDPLASYYINAAFNDKIPSSDELMGATNCIDALFGLKMKETLTCDETMEFETTTIADTTMTTATDNANINNNDTDMMNIASEPPVITYDLTRKLVCNIQGGVVDPTTSSTTTTSAPLNVNYINEGIQLSLEGKIEKHSTILGRNAIWSRSQRIARLPQLLVVQFQRFYWKATPDSEDHPNGVKCKVMKPVTFQNELDVYSFCTTDIQKVLQKARDKAFAAEEDIITKKLKGQIENNNISSSIATTTTNDSTTTPMVVDTTSSDTAQAATTENEEEDDDELKAALAMSMQTEETTIPIGPGLPNNFRGIYELFAVVTHKGRDADGGHYMAWVKSDTNTNTTNDSNNDDWYVFDDDEVSPCKTEDVLKLKGGGDWHMSYLNFYRAKK